MGTVGQPRDLPGQIPGDPPVHRRPVHSHPGSYRRYLSAVQDRTNRVQALLDNRHLHQRQSRPPATPTPANDEDQEKPNNGTCKPCGGTEMSSIYRDRTSVAPGEL